MKKEEEIMQIYAAANVRLHHHLEQHYKAFKELVIEHTKRELTLLEYKHYRFLAKNEMRHVIKGETICHKLTDLVDQAISEDGLTVNEIIMSYEGNQLSVIGTIEGQPMYYVQGEGVYFWGRSEDSLPIISLWLTYPAYPPNW